MNDFDVLINLFWSFLWICGACFMVLMSLVIMKRMVVGKSTYSGSSSSNKDSIDVALITTITSSSND
ncbi:hypothetical protein [Bacillus sp. TH13]|uniref:hypothetical protein n=1 Tax=Bacillus sp. TH13 TaxID=2796379 RepID=UPI0019121104|nr:hypothetical protein [Bacillus sp. TH13]MBK5491711.1 hypothetical protein [Bacillus sp. TH13]MBK5492150.1 hypothetical protein [Bacillus sp. TH13]